MGDDRPASSESCCIYASAAVSADRSAPFPSRHRRICSSVKFGSPASLGARYPQSVTGCTGRNHIGAPISHCFSSHPPCPSLGVWHSPHFATCSTRYSPRATGACGKEAAANPVTTISSTRPARTRFVREFIMAESGIREFRINLNQQRQLSQEGRLDSLSLPATPPQILAVARSPIKSLATEVF